MRRRRIISASVTLVQSTQVLVNVGDHVQEGQVLARLHAHDLHEAVSAYQSALAEAERTRRLMEFTRGNRERYDSLYQIKFASRQEAERAAMGYRNAVADHDKAQAMLLAARTHLADMLEVADDKISESDLRATSLPVWRSTPALRRLSFLVYQRFG